MTESYNKTLAYKYAMAFLACFKDQLNEELIMQIQHAVDHMNATKNYLFLFDRVYALSPDQEQLFQLIMQQYRLPALVKKLLTLLVADKRVYLLHAILKKLIELYYTYKKITTFTVASMPALQESEKRQIEQFIEKRFGTGHRYQYRTDPTLIAGVRIQSSTALWEYSWAGQLRQMALSLIE